MFGKVISSSGQFICQRGVGHQGPDGEQLIAFVEEQMTTLGDGVKVTVEEEECPETEVDQQFQKIECDGGQHDVPDDIVEGAVEYDDGDDDGCCQQ